MMLFQLFVEINFNFTISLQATIPLYTRALETTDKNPGPKDGSILFIFSMDQGDYHYPRGDDKYLVERALVVPDGVYHLRVRSSKQGECAGSIPCEETQPRTDQQ